MDYPILRHPSFSRGYSLSPSLAVCPCRTCSLSFLNRYFFGSNWGYDGIPLLSPVVLLPPTSCNSFLASRQFTEHLLSGSLWPRWDVWWLISIFLYTSPPTPIGASSFCQTNFIAPKRKKKKLHLCTVRYKDISLTPVHIFPQLKIRA